MVQQWMFWKFGQVQCSRSDKRILGCKCVDNIDNEYGYSYNWSDFAWISNGSDKCAMIGTTAVVDASDLHGWFGA